MKKALSLLLALCLLGMAVTAGAAVTPKGEFPVTDEPVTLRVAVPVDAKGEDIHTNEFTLYLEEGTGIDLDIIELSPSDTATQVNTIMLSEALAAKGFEIDRKNIILKDKAIKEVGKYTASVRLYKSIKANINFNVITEAE